MKKLSLTLTASVFALSVAVPAFAVTDTSHSAQKDESKFLTMALETANAHAGQSGNNDDSENRDPGLLFSSVSGEEDTGDENSNRGFLVSSVSGEEDTGDENSNRGFLVSSVSGEEDTGDENSNRGFLVS